MNKVLCLLLSLLSTTAIADQRSPLIRIGTLAFGTVNWEIAAIRNDGLDKKFGIALDAQTLANPEAGKIGLKAGSLDIIATDWIWVANQAQTGADYRYIPYSTHAGAVMVGKNSAIQSIVDLRGKRIGIVGGPLDKNWLLLRTYAMEKFNLDLDTQAEKVFGAPPLLNQQLADGKLDALVNFWHYATKLENQGYRKLIDGKDVVKGLGVAEPMPNVGYVFKQSWASQNGKALDQFVAASKEARNLLCTEDSAWNKVAPLTQETDIKAQTTLRKEYCAGVVQQWTAADRDAAGKVYQLLRKTGGDELTGKAERLPMEIFWPYELKATP